MPAAQRVQGVNTMRTVKVSACQFPIARGGFDDFKTRVVEAIGSVPKDSNYVLFPELFTVGLLTSFPDASSVADLIRIVEFTPVYRELFRRIATERKQFILAGSHLEKHGDRYLNVAHLFTPEGRELTHQKSHIFPAESGWKTSEGDTLEVWDLGPAKVGVAICYEGEIPEVCRILAYNGAEIILCPSFTFSEAGFWRVRHCAQARCIENQIYYVHCCTIGDAGAPLPPGYGRSSILSPCDRPWNPNGIVAEAETNKQMVISASLDIDALYENRRTGAATTFNDRTRRMPMYSEYQPYRQGAASSETNSGLESRQTAK
jgi:predicted amidohydrolase